MPTIAIVDLLMVHLSAGTGLHGVGKVAVLDINDETRGLGLDIEPAGGEVIGSDREGLCSGRRR